MVGYVKDGKGVFGIMTDYVDATLTQFLRNLVKEYANIPTVDTRCGYACRFVCTHPPCSIQHPCFEHPLPVLSTVVTTQAGIRLATLPCFLLKRPSATATHTFTLSRTSCQRSILTMRSSSARLHSLFWSSCPPSEQSTHRPFLEEL